MGMTELPSDHEGKNEDVEGHGHACDELTMKAEDPTEDWVPHENKEDTPLTEATMEQIRELYAF